MNPKLRMHYLWTNYMPYFVAIAACAAGLFLDWGLTTSFFPAFATMLLLEVGGAILGLIPITSSDTSTPADGTQYDNSKSNNNNNNNNNDNNDNNSNNNSNNTVFEIDAKYIQQSFKNHKKTNQKRPKIV